MVIRAYSTHHTIYLLAGVPLEVKNYVFLKRERHLRKKKHVLYSARDVPILYTYKVTEMYYMSAMLLPLTTQQF